MPDAKLALTAFLSHKYKAPVVNEYFFQLFSQSASAEFEVDVGSAPTNVTRLERAVRDADAFIGIYPFDELGTDNPSLDDLTRAARYFRLELDLAARARKPGLIFTDLRFRGILSAPAPIRQVVFDVQEVAGGGSKPSSPKFIRAFQTFAEQVRAARDYALVEEGADDGTNLVGILLPPDSAGLGYKRDQIDAIVQTVNAARYEAVELPWPPVITPEWIGKIRSLDWMVLDVGAISFATGVVGYLHGEFKPALRLLRVPESSGNAVQPPFVSALYAGFDVGYLKDIVSWSKPDALIDGLKNRITTLDAERRRISTPEDALTYFRSAALRKEAVFVSYAGADQDAAKDLIDGLRKRFQQVFDYRDGKSIRPGQPWLEEIFGRLAVSPIGVPLLSSAYVASGNCMHELREMVAHQDSKKMQIFPIKLNSGDKFDQPAILGDIQYLRRSEYDTVDKLVSWLIQNISSE